ncbi:MAG: response regulator transcription factor, partial [Planctomycetota bacterium]
MISLAEHRGAPANLNTHTTSLDANSAATVYVVDDDEHVRGSLTMLMESVNQPVEAYSSAQEFLEVWDGQPGGVLVLDIRMPEMSGLALQERLEKTSAVMPIIFITGYGDISTAVRAMRHGAFDFVQKPYRSQDMLDTIQRALALCASALENHRRRKRALDHM